MATEGDKPTSIIDPSKDWQVQIEMAQREQKDWQDKAKKVVERYRSEKVRANARNKGAKFNILYSNTEVTRSALYGRTAKPDVRRRFADQDPVGREAAEIMERSLIYCTDAYDTDGPIDAGVLDFTLTGRGVCRVEYEPQLGQKPVIDPMTGQPQVGDDQQPVMRDFVANQTIKEVYVYWEDFLHSPARAWAKVWWVGFRHTMDREELEEAFPEHGAKIPLNWTPNVQDKTGSVPEGLMKAEVWEVWDKKNRERVWIVKGYPAVCRKDKDPYTLEQFFPLPEPPISYGTNENLIPEPPITAYQDQADDLDECTRRISILTKALKRRGVYDQSVKELKQLAGAGDNQFIAVENYAALSQKGGLAASFQSEDLATIAQVLLGLYQQRDMLVQAIYEITGMSDIMRGSTNASETLGAQQLKSQFGSMRIKRWQRKVQNWIRDLYRIKVEIIAEHFEPHVLQDMTQIQITPQIMQLLREDKMRSYRIDIETDSTIFEDAAAEKQSRIEAITAIGQFMEKAMPIVQMKPELTPLMFSMLTFTVRSFKEGRELEDDIEQAKQQLEQAAQKPPSPDPELEKSKMEMGMKKEEHQMDMESKQFDMQIDERKAGMELTKLGAQTQAAVIKANTRPPERVQ